MFAIRNINDWLSPDIHSISAKYTENDLFEFREGKSWISYSYGEAAVLHIETNMYSSLGWKYLNSNE